MTKATPEDVQRLLAVLRDMPDQAGARQSWSAFSRADWPVLFPLIDLAADLPRLAPNRTLTAFPAGLWPELDSVRDGLYRLQDLVERPVVPRDARVAAQHGIEDLDAAARDLDETHCVHVSFLLEPDGRDALDREIERLMETKLGSWGELERSASPAVYEIFERALDSARFRRLTGFDVGRDEYTLTLSLQDLQPQGIGWHRDLYWPKEWVGEDVFAVLYALGSDSPGKGGAFLHYVPWHNEVYALYREKHQATVMWNSADSDGRLIHAVSEYLTPETARHLIILQCHRRRRSAP